MVKLLFKLEYVWLLIERLISTYKFSLITLIFRSSKKTSTKKISLFPDIASFINFNKEYPFESLNLQAAHFIETKYDLFNCLTEGKHQLDRELLKIEIFGKEGKLFRSDKFNYNNLNLKQNYICQ